MKFRLLAIAATAMFYGACVEGAEPKDSLSDVAGPETAPEPDDGPELDVAFDLIAPELPGPDVLPSSCEQKCDGRGTCSDFEADNVQACKWRCQNSPGTEQCLDENAPCQPIPLQCDIGEYTCADDCNFLDGADCLAPTDGCQAACAAAPQSAREDFLQCTIIPGTFDCDPDKSQTCLTALKLEGK